MQLKSKARTQKTERGKIDRPLNLFDSNKFADLYESEFIMTFELKQADGSIEAIDFVCRYQDPTDSLTAFDQGLIVKTLQTERKLESVDRDIEKLDDDDMVDVLHSEAALRQATLLQCIIEPKLTKEQLKVIPLAWQHALFAEITKGANNNIELVSEFREED